LDSAGEILFGTNIDSLHDPESKFGAAFDNLQASTAYRSLVYYIWKAGLVSPGNFYDSLTYMDNFVDDIIEKCYNDQNLENREDLLAQYVKTVEKSTTEMEIKMDKTYLRNMCKNMLIAARDTTACLLTWTIFELSQRPDVEAKLLEEIDHVVGMHNQTPTAEQLSELKYMKQVLNETLRLHPSVPFDVRTSVDEDWLPNGYYIPPNTDVLYSSYMTHRLVEYWGPDAEKFDPTRWEPERIRGVPSFAFVPFHAGPRICLGQNMAYEEAKIALLLILQKYHLQCVDRPQDVEYRNIIILQVKGQMNVRVTRRN